MSVYRYALVVVKNENLLDLWDINSLAGSGTPPLQILNGGFFFQENPKLCINKIERFVHWSNMSHLLYDRERTMSVHSNGDEAACKC